PRRLIRRSRQEGLRATLTVLLAAQPELVTPVLQVVRRVVTGHIAWMAPSSRRIKATAAPSR
ncbi:hypothetical protein, partial [Azohydromonas sp.]|uniref:hypothetical protein n=1 Tax=Azohydromonas sp. TaxID=1872666 RepID=UPI002BA2A1D8